MKNSRGKVSNVEYRLPKASVNAKKFQNEFKSLTESLKRTIESFQEAPMLAATNFHHK